MRFENIKPKIGLLPFGNSLYDKIIPEIRPNIEAFILNIIKKFEDMGIIVKVVPLCRIKEEFLRAVSFFEKDKVDAIVTIHLVYSPSLEACEALSKTKIPIIILDTTPNYNFGPDQNYEEFIYNHGIHGVQDICNVLIRNGKDFIIEVGHWEKSNVIDKIIKHIRAAIICKLFNNSRVGSIGKLFEGMGDVYVKEEVLRENFGIKIKFADFEEILKLFSDIDDGEVRKELMEDFENFEIIGLNEKLHLDSIKSGLAVRKWIDRENLSSFTMNFFNLKQDSNFQIIPFFEASKEMARRIGYAGEGDVLTAVLVGALIKVFPETNFTEMFCPDWMGNRIFISHSGEINNNIIEGKGKLIIKRSPFFSNKEAVMIVGKYKSGNAVLVNLAPGKDNTYTLIICKVIIENVLNDIKMSDVIHGWFKPEKGTISDFLGKFSSIGGTHHCALVYGDILDELISFGRIMKWKTMVI